VRLKGTTLIPAQRFASVISKKVNRRATAVNNNSGCKIRLVINRKPGNVDKFLFVLKILIFVGFCLISVPGVSVKAGSGSLPNNIVNKP